MNAREIGEMIRAVDGRLLPSGAFVTRVGGNTEALRKIVWRYLGTRAGAAWANEERGRWERIAAERADVRRFVAPFDAEAWDRSNPIRRAA